MDQIVRSAEEVNLVLDKAAQGFDRGSAYPGQSYEEGIQDYHRWLVGETDEEPLADVKLETDD